jgi:hypothetical protein
MENMMTKEEYLEKILYVNALCGKGFLSSEHAHAMTKKGLAQFIGNQWNEKWQWLRAELFKLSLEELKTLYYKP